MGNKIVQCKIAFTFIFCFFDNIAIKSNKIQEKTNLIEYNFENDKALFYLKFKKTMAILLF